jgi:hypothetical protein
MANVTKSTLKGYFQRGSIPSQENFETLVDATLAPASSSLNSGEGVQGTGDTFKLDVSEINSEKILTCIVDLRGLSSSATTDTVVGVSGSSESHLVQWDTSSFGLPYKVELACAETPVGGQLDFDVKFSGSAQPTFAAVTQSANSVVAGTNFNAGEIRSNTNSTMTGVPSHDDFIFLTNGGSGTTGIYTAGKLIIKFYGI